MRVDELCLRAKAAAFDLAGTDTETKNRILETIADAIENGAADILKANAADLAAYSRGDLSFRDRLTLNEKRIDAMAEGVRQVAKLADPVGESVEEWTAPNGLNIKKVRAPLGVIGVIYEARPNVTVDVVSLCVKSGNAVVLKGGKDAVNSNGTLCSIMKNALNENNLPSDFIQFIDDTDRAATLELLKQSDSVDVIIPRGGESLKRFVLENAAMPVIASAGGNCHIFVDESADLKKALDIILNAKLQRPSVCNACEQALIHSAVVEKFAPVLFDALKKEGCVLKGDATVRKYCPAEEASESDYAEEHLGLILSAKTVGGVDEAIGRINRYGTKHSDAIISRDDKNISEFVKRVDSGCIYVNASTRFTDGFEFGFGAEIAISTQKLHARGPLGLRQLTSEKYICIGDGTIRK